MSFQGSDIFLPTPLRLLTRAPQPPFLALILVPRKPDAPSAVSRSARRVPRRLPRRTALVPTPLAYQRRPALGLRVNCGTRYGHGFLEQVIGIVLQQYAVHQETRGARVRAKRAGLGLGGWLLERVRRVRFGKKYGPLSRHRGDGTLRISRCGKTQKSCDVQRQRGCFGNLSV